jgi:phytoene dehydrogenase-like protein
MTARARKRVVIIGSGVDALVAACRVARCGHETLVLEQRDDAGGTHARWPGAPDVPAGLVVDDPSPLHPAVARDLASHGLEVDPTPATLAAFDAAGRMLELSGSVDASRAAIARVSPRDAQAYPRFHATLDRIGSAIAPLMRRAPPRERLEFGDVLTALMAGRGYLGLAREDVFAMLRWPPMPVADLASEWFESDVLRALVATRGLFGTFAGPRSGGTTAALLLRALADGGLIRQGPRVGGGPPALVRSLVRCGNAAGVTLRLGSRVDAIVVTGDRAAGVLLADGTHVGADAVLSSLGPHRTLLDLLDPVALSPETMRRARNVRSRGSVARALLIVDEVPPIHVPGASPYPMPQAWHVAPDLDSLERAFDAMKYGTWADDPWIDVHVTGVSEAAGSAGTAGPNALAVTAHFVPPILRGRPWSSARDWLADRMTAALERVAPGLTSRIVSRHVLTPGDLSTDLGLPGGHPLHAEIALDQLWVARPALGLGGYRSPVEGLYVCGPGTHPGIGRLGTSGMLASREILRDMRASRARTPR